MVFYPVLIVGFMIIEARANGPSLLVWMTACLLGISFWTLVEYMLHRFVLHKLPGIAQLHDRHHVRPSAFVGTPVWISFIAWLIVFLLLWRISDFEIASGGLSGLILGYVWYLLVHDAVHRWPLKQDSWLLKVRRRHLLHHHHSDRTGNFGVSTGFWDAVFKTEISRKPSAFGAAASDLFDR